MTRRAAIATLIEVKTPSDLSSEGTSNYSNDPWSYDEIFTCKKIIFRTLKYTVAIQKQASHRNTVNSSGQVDNVCAHL